MSGCTLTLTITRWMLLRALPAGWWAVVRTVDVSPRWAQPLVWLYAVAIFVRAAFVILFGRRPS